MISFYLIAFVFGAIMYYWFNKKNENLPPGPTGLPLVGNLLQMEKQSHLTFSRWSKQFPKLYKVDILSSRFIVISDYKLAKEMFSESTYAGRCGIKWVDAYEDGELHGIISTEGDVWEQLRRFTLRQLRDFGFGKNSMESQIIEEVKELLEWMKTQEGRPIPKIKEKFTIAVVNSLWSIISGKRYRHDDPVLIDLSDRLQQAFTKIAESGGLLLFAPWLRHIIPEKSGFKFMRKIMNDLCTFFTETATEHEKTRQEDEPRDFIDVFLQEINHVSDKNSPFNKKQLVGCIGDLFQAGTDTTSSTLSWIMIYLPTYPEVQKKFQKEIELTTGNSRYCSLTDRPNMPYTEALIAEVTRFSSIISMSVPHRALTNNAKFQGYDIPSDAQILANMHYIHHNPEIWGDPENFRPERFLSPDGKSFKKHEALMPFSIGRRQCLGESLAKDTLLLFATNIFQRFDVELDPKEPHPGLEPAIGFMLNPKPFKVILKDRLV